MERVPTVCRGFVPRYSCLIIPTSIRSEWYWIAANAQWQTAAGLSGAWPCQCMRKPFICRLLRKRPETLRLSQRVIASLVVIAALTIDTAYHWLLRSAAPVSCSCRMTAPASIPSRPSPGWRRVFAQQVREFLKTWPACLVNSGSPAVLKGSGMSSPPWSELPGKCMPRLAASIAATRASQTFA